MLVTIVIPCYMQAKYLQEAIDSVLAQTYPHWECIIVNDASPDDTAAVAAAAAAADGRIRVIHKVENEGLAAARNSGIVLGVGRYILPLDADDKIAPEYLETCIEVLQSEPKVKVAYTDVLHFGVDNSVIVRPEFSLQALLHQNQFQPVALYRREAFESTKGYRHIPFGYEDWDFWLQLIGSDAEARRIPNTLTHIRVKEQSMVTEISGSFEKDQNARKLIYILNKKKYRKHAPALAIWFERQTGSNFFRITSLRISLWLKSIFA